MKVLLNATPRELARISGDMSFYRDLIAADRGTGYALVPRAAEAARLPPKLAERIAARLPAGAAFGPLRRRLFQWSRRRPIAAVPPLGWGQSAGAPAVDVVLSHITLPPARADRRQSPPLIWSSQGLSPPAYYEAAGPVGYDDVVALYETCAREAAALLVWTQSGADRLRAEARLETPVVVLPPIAPPRLPSQVPPRTADIHVLFVGRDARRKGLNELVAAFERLGVGLAGGARRVAFDVVGAPPPDLAASLAALAGRGVEVRLRSDLDDPAVAALMARADLLALPTKAETFGYVLVEAMAAGCALLTADAPPMNELVRDGETGRVVPPGDIEALAEALRDLLADPSRLEAMGAAARARWRADFAPGVLVPRYRSLYRAVAAGADPGEAARAVAAPAAEREQAA